MPVSTVEIFSAAVEPLEELAVELVVVAMAVVVNVVVVEVELGGSSALSVATVCENRELRAE